MGTAVVTARTSGAANEAARALRDTLLEKLAGRAPALVMVFASTEQPLAEVMPVLVDAFEGACVLGASSR